MKHGELFARALFSRCRVDEPAQDGYCSAFGDWLSAPARDPKSLSAQPMGRTRLGRLLAGREPRARLAPPSSRRAWPQAPTFWRAFDPLTASSTISFSKDGNRRFRSQCTRLRGSLHIGQASQFTGIQLSINSQSTCDFNGLETSGLSFQGGGGVINSSPIHAVFCYAGARAKFVPSPFC